MGTDHFWLLKTEPTSYSYADLQHDGVTMWDGVANTVALKHMRAMEVGDLALIYHTGDERRVVGIAEVIRAAYADPQASDPRMLVIDLRVVGPLAAPVSLASIKADPFFSDFALVRQGRLSVVPVTAAQWERLLALAS